MITLRTILLPHQQKYRFAHDLVPFAYFTERVRCCFKASNAVTCSTSTAKVVFGKVDLLFNRPLFQDILGSQSSFLRSNSARHVGTSLHVVVPPSDWVGDRRGDRKATKRKERDSCELHPGFLVFEECWAESSCRAMHCSMFW